MPTLIQQVRKDRNVVCLLLASFFTTASRGMTLPFLPLFLHQTLAMSLMSTGTTLTLAMSLGTIMSVPVGKLADRVPHRILMMATLSVFALSFMLIAGSRSPLLFVLAYTLITMTASVYLSIVKCYLSEHFTRVDKSTLFSVNYTVINIGWISGPVIGAQLFPISPLLPFWLSSACGLIALGLIFPLRFHASVQRVSDIASRPMAAARWRVLMIFTAGIFLSTFVYGRFASCLAQILMTRLDTTTIGHIISSLVMVNAATVIAFQYLINQACSKMSPGRALVLGMTCLIAGIGIFSVADTHLLVWAAGVCLFSLGEIIFIPLQYRLIDAVATEGNRALCFSFQNLGELGGALNPAITAWILIRFSTEATYATLVLAVILAGVLFLMGRRSLSHTDDTPRTPCPSDR